ncbi:PQQ-binding-like beta-propeller repeat protein [bacterium]|nr:PQQ-binding-like beta-propeller repeat protein [bacterium]
MLAIMKIAGLAFLFVLNSTAFGSDPDGIQWPGFRGPGASGISEGYATATSWSVSDGDNIKWKTEIPGLGLSCPVIWGDQVFLTTAISGKKDPYLKVGLYGNIDPVEDDTVHKWKLYCLDKKRGKMAWEKTITEGVPKIKRHTKASHANSTPVTDGKHLVVFLGSEGLYCYGLDGELHWQKDLGVLDSGYFKVREAQWGFASSPIIAGRYVIVQCDVQENSFVAAFDIGSGKEVWRTARDEVPTWSTPAVYNHRGQTQVILNGWKHIGGYDLSTGEEIWRMRGGGDIPVPTPISSHGLIFIANAHGGQAPIYAIRPTATGDISLTDDATSNDHIAWSERRNGAYMQTPLVYGDYIYSSRDNGGLNCYEVQTGKRVYRERLAGGRTGFTASPVAANDKIYFTSEVGDIYVLQAGPTFKVLATNAMDEVCLATPAISEGVLFFRTRQNLVAVAER